MKIGLFSMGEGSCIEPETAIRVAQTAERVGFESLWAGEHVVLPDPRVAPSPLEPTDPILDPLVTLSFLAACTKTINLGTGIIILPQRNPLVLAKQLASLDQLASGRLYFGLGVGYLQPEMDAIGVPYNERGARTEEYLAAMQAIWTQPKPEFQGRFVSFSGVQAYPKRPVKIVMGGHSTAALRRAIQSAGGWFGFGHSPASAAEPLAEINRLKETTERPASLGELEISITPETEVPVTKALVKEFAALGVHRLIIAPPKNLNSEQLEEFVARTADELIV